MEPIIINGELYHHGIAGQRWYHKNGPPYPLRPGMHSSKEKGLAKDGISTLSTYVKNETKKIKKKRSLEKARKARQEKKRKEEEKRQHEENREKVLKSGSASDVLKYKGELTADEIKKVIERIDAEKNLADYARRDIVTAEDKVNKAVKKLDKVTEWAGVGIKFYNTVAKVVNAFNEEDIMPPIFDPSAKADYRKKVAEARKAEKQDEQQDITNKITKETLEKNKIERKIKKQEYKTEKKKQKEERRRMREEWDQDRNAKKEEKRQERNAEKEEKRQERIAQKDDERAEKARQKAEEEYAKELNDAFERDSINKAEEKLSKVAKEYSDERKNNEDERQLPAVIKKQEEDRIKETENKEKRQKEVDEAYDRMEKYYSSGTYDSDDVKKSISTVNDSIARIGMKDVDDYTDDLLKKNKKNLGL